MTETPFKIAVAETNLQLLRQKLELTVLPDELDEAGWDYGAPLTDIRRLVARWKDGYDWRKHEAQINAELPQFTRDIDVEGFGTLNIHYVHQKSNVDAAIPLLFVHGWPGSFLEVRKILPLLLQGSNEHPAFHVVALSLPGYIFSDAPRKKGFAAGQYAEARVKTIQKPPEPRVQGAPVFTYSNALENFNLYNVGNKLMLALGYNQYVTQAGDWGHIVTRFIAHRYGSTHARAWHTNLPLATPPSPLRSPLIYIADRLFRYSAVEKASIARTEWYHKKTSGYFTLQATAPQTLGYSLADSPVGLLAWIYEKLVLYADEEYKWDDDEVLTWISLYWFSRAGPAASVRLYHEMVEYSGNPFTTLVPVKIPIGYSFFPREAVGYPRRWFKSPHLVFKSEHTSGGHFASTEKPEELVSDLRRMFGRLGPAFGVVQGRTGYASAAK